MYSFFTHFIICNVYIIIFILILMMIKKVLKNHLSKRIQYNIWFLLIVALIMPFIQQPFEYMNLEPSFTNSILLSQVEKISNTFIQEQNKILNSMNDYAISVNNHNIIYCFMIIWIIGIIIMMITLLKSIYYLYQMKKASLPVQNKDVQNIYQSCLLKLNIKKYIPVYSCLFIESPMLAGWIKPCIYIPIHLISDLNKDDMFYMLLHELNHYFYKDHLINVLMNILISLYWLNPFVWYAFNEMKLEREMACDSSTLDILNEEEYINYGYTLISLAKKKTKSSFPISNHMSGTMKQIKRRIINISHHKKESYLQRIKGYMIYFCIFIMTLLFVPILTTKPYHSDRYSFIKEDKNIIYTDYSNYFDNYDGSFVLYDLQNNQWTIYNEQYASLRVSPHSTYKIYDALFALESQIITVDDSVLKWNQQNYPFDEWEANHNLKSAMNYSVNWYFQDIDTSMGHQKISSFLKEINYGNQTMGHDINIYWSDNSLKISPIEQVEILQNFHHNAFGFSTMNINAVKESIRLSTQDDSAFYGKTGTGRVNGEDVNGWFIGFIETDDNVYYFATNIQGKTQVTGSVAEKISISILNDKNIWIK